MEKKKKGFTLIEVIVALGAFMIIMLAITSILMTTIKYTGINKRTFDSNSISREFFEVMKENRISMPMDTATPPQPNPKKLTSGNDEVSFKASFDDKDGLVEKQVRYFVINKFLKGTVPITDELASPALPSDFTSCKGSFKYSMGIKIKWTPLNATGTPTKGVYEIETWCWDTNKGESSLVNRKTFLAPK